MGQNGRVNESGLTLRSRRLRVYYTYYQLYGISFLSFAVCDGAEYAVNDKQFFLPGRLVTFKCEWPACARLKAPDAMARHLFFVPEWVFNFG